MKRNHVYDSGCLDSGTAASISCVNDKVTRSPEDTSVGREVRPYIPKRLRTQTEPKELTTVKLTVNTSEDNKNTGQLSNPSQQPDLCHGSTDLLSTDKPSQNVASDVQSRIPCSESNRCHAHSKPISCIRCSDVSKGVACSASLDSKLALININSGTVVKYLESHTGGVKDVRWSQDGQQLISGGFDGKAIIHDVESGKPTLDVQFKGFVSSVLYHPVNHHVCLVGTSECGISAIDSRSSQVVKRYKTHIGQVHDLLFLPNGTTFLSAAEVLKKQCIDKTIIAWDYESSAIVSNQIYQDPFSCGSLRLHPNKPEFLAQSGAGYVIIFSSTPPYKMNKFKRYQGHQTAGYRIGFSVSPDGSLLATGDKQGKVYIYDYYSSRIKKCLELKKNEVITDVCFHPTLPSPFLSSTWSGYVSIWN